MCEGVPSDSEWVLVEPQSFSFSKKRNFACRTLGGHELRRNASKGSSLPKKKDDDAVAVAELLFRQWKKEALGALRKERPLQGWSST